MSERIVDVLDKLIRSMHGGYAETKLIDMLLEPLSNLPSLRQENLCCVIMIKPDVCPTAALPGY